MKRHEIAVLLILTVISLMTASRADALLGTAESFAVLAHETVTSTGALRPNTCAVVMTTSESPQVLFIAARCFWICSSVSALA